MSLLSATLKLDMRLQSRSKLYAIGIVVAVLCGLAARFLVHPDYAGRVLVVFYLAGLGSTTYMISASLVLLEKSAGTIQALRTTPLTSTAYITSKVISLTAFAVFESTIFFAVAFLGVPLNPLPMIFGVICLGAFYTLVGLGQVASYDSITAFLFPGAGIVTGILQLPVLFLFDAGPSELFCVVPTQGPLLLMLGATEPLLVWQWAYAIVVSMGSIVLAFWWAKCRFTQFITLQEG